VADLGPIADIGSEQVVLSDELRSRQQEIRASLNRHEKAQQIDIRADLGDRLSRGGIPTNIA